MVPLTPAPDAGFRDYSLGFRLTRVGFSDARTSWRAWASFLFSSFLASNCVAVNHSISPFSPRTHCPPRPPGFRAASKALRLFWASISSCDIPPLTLPPAPPLPRPAASAAVFPCTPTALMFSVAALTLWVREREREREIERERIYLSLCVPVCLCVSLSLSHARSRSRSCSRSLSPSLSLSRARAFSLSACACAKWTETWP